MLDLSEIVNIQNPMVFSSFCFVYVWRCFLVLLVVCWLFCFETEFLFIAQTILELAL